MSHELVSKCIQCIMCIPICLQICSKGFKWYGLSYFTILEVWAKLSKHPIPPTIRESFCQWVGFETGFCPYKVRVLKDGLWPTSIIDGWYMRMCHFFGTIGIWRVLTTFWITRLPVFWSMAISKGTSILATYQNVATRKFKQETVALTSLNSFLAITIGKGSIQWEPLGSPSFCSQVCRFQSNSVIWR